MEDHIKQTTVLMFDLLNEEEIFPMLLFWIPIFCQSQTFLPVALAPLSTLSGLVWDRWKGKLFLIELLCTTRTSD